MASPNAIINSDYGPIIINVHDSIIGRQIAETGYYSQPDIELIKHLADFLIERKGSLVFYDVGANVGTHSLAVAKTYGGQVLVRAFEAQRQLYNMLCGTIAINGLSNVLVHNCAVSDTNGEELSIKLPDYNRDNNFGGLELIPALRSDNATMTHSITERIKTVTLDSLEERVDFVKMDIEGMEDRAIRGATRLIDQHRPICFIEIMKTDIDFLLGFFRERNYVGFHKNADVIAIPLEYQLQVNGLERIV